MPEAASLFEVDMPSESTDTLTTSTALASSSCCNMEALPHTDFLSAD